MIARDWLADGRRVVACTLVETVGSAPLDPGAEMVIDDSGRIEGSVTGGCVEGTLVEEAERIFADVVLVFTHDRKFDEPALVAALETDAGYIGALGSRRTHADRVRRLRERGVDDDQLGRIASPCGLDIGARTPAETAISIVGEAIARRTGRGREPLGETAGPIHGREAALS